MRLRQWNGRGAPDGSVLPEDYSMVFVAGLVNPVSGERGALGLPVVYVPALRRTDLWDVANMARDGDITVDYDEWDIMIVDGVRRGLVHRFAVADDLSEDEFAVFFDEVNPVTREFLEVVRDTGSYVISLQGGVHEDNETLDGNVFVVELRELPPQPPERVA